MLHDLCCTLRSPKGIIPELIKRAQMINLASLGNGSPSHKPSRTQEIAMLLKRRAAVLGSQHADHHFPLEISQAFIISIYLNSSTEMPNCSGCSYAG